MTLSKCTAQPSRENPLINDKGLCFHWGYFVWYCLNKSMFCVASQYTFCLHLAVGQKAVNVAIAWCNSAVMSGLQATATIATMLSFNSKGLAIVRQFYCRFPSFPGLFHSGSLSNTKHSGSHATSDHCLGTKPTPTNLHVRQELPPGC